MRTNASYYIHVLAECTGKCSRVRRLLIGHISRACDERKFKIKFFYFTGFFLLWNINQPTVALSCCSNFLIIQKLHYVCAVQHRNRYFARIAPTCRYRNQINIINNIYLYNARIFQFFANYKFKWIFTTIFTRHYVKRKKRTGEKDTRLRRKLRIYSSVDQNDKTLKKNSHAETPNLIIEPVGYQNLNNDFLCNVWKFAIQ